MNACAASAMFAIDRFASYQEDWGAFYESGGVAFAVLQRDRRSWTMARTSWWMSSGGRGAPSSYQEDWGAFYESGGVVVANRYTTSNAVHQASKLLPEGRRDFLDRRSWTMARTSWWMSSGGRGAPSLAQLTTAQPWFRPPPGA